MKPDGANRDQWGLWRVWFGAFRVKLFLGPLSKYVSVTYLLYARLCFGLRDPAGDKIDRTPATGELMFQRGRQKKIRK